MADFFNNVLFFFVLFNPFLMSIYLLDLIKDLSPQRFLAVMIRASLISSAVFIAAALIGEALFDRVLFVRFASFQIFGGAVFVIIGIRAVFQGAESMRALRGDPELLEGSVAMPFMIGPGTLSASILIGSRLPALPAAGAIITTLVCTVLTLVLLKRLHDRINQINSKLIDRYVDIVGRLSALYIGTIAIEMIVLGVRGWLGAF